MKAIVHRAFGSPDVLKLEEIDKPVPGDNEVLIKVRAASINPLDWRMVMGAPSFVLMLFGLRKGKINRPGKDVAGRVEAVGAKVTRFQRGDEVFGACRGSCAEFACGPESMLAIRPESMTAEHAASVPIAAITALQGLRDKGQIRAGHKVLINGAAGGVGTFAVQIARSFGADVTGVCSTKNMAMVRSIGAGHVVDYTREDFVSKPERYDLILDCVGHRTLSEYKRVLQREGRCVMIGAPKQMAAALSFMLKAFVASWLSNRFHVFMARMNARDLELLADLMVAGKVTPVIDRRFRLSETRDAMRYAMEGHTRGKVVITVGT